LKSTANFSDHDLFKTNGEPEWIDFILLNPKEGVKQNNSRIEEPRQTKNGEHIRLSDHNIIRSTIVIESN